MNNYKDKFGFYHDKKSLNKEPSSNNAWIYTSYAKSLGLTIDYKQLEFFYDVCKINDSNSYWFILRRRGLFYPPISRDEIIGMYSLGFKPLLNNKYFMFRAFKNYSFLDYIIALKKLFKIRNEHRNYFWEKRLYETFPVAMKIWWHDRYYLDLMSNQNSSFFKWFMFQLYALSTILQNNISAKNVLTLQLQDLNSKFWIKFINKKKNYKKYFEKEHIFNTYLERL